jgi:hypothetical protein
MLLYSGHIINTCCAFLGQINCFLYIYVYILLHSCYILSLTELLLTLS